GLQLRGWLVPADPGARHAVVLAAGIRGNRLAMCDRASFYLQRGWSVLLVDLRGTGASDGERVSMGYHEAVDLHAWRRWLQQRGYTAVGAHGQSLGAAAIAYSDGDWAFTVLESCYADIDEAMAARLPWLPAPRVCLWPLRCCSEWLLGVDAAQLRPVDAIADQRCPTLLLCGDADTKVGVDAGQRLLRACPAADKRFVPFAGAGHVDLLAAAPEAMHEALVTFVPRVE
ncbi:MAG: alpha/beta hydrolase, partial [Planctomycetes bacterium]|nr:alpha/beta hydrolase [Planctomycetota bacterium]